MEAVIRVENVTKRFGDVVALDHINAVSNQEIFTAL